MVAQLHALPSHFATSLAPLQTGITVLKAAEVSGSTSSGSTQLPLDNNCCVAAQLVISWIFLSVTSINLSKVLVWTSNGETPFSRLEAVCSCALTELATTHAKTVNTHFFKKIDLTIITPFHPLIDCFTCPACAIKHLNFVWIRTRTCC